MSLPIDALLPELRATLAQTCALVLQAPPGSGKTTRVPLALLGLAPGQAASEPDWLAGRRIVMLEPRRLAARAAAGYMASLIGEPVGRRVGYRTRLDTRVSQDTRIEVVTEGILARLLRDDPELSAYGAVIFDEFHERSLQADLGLALTRECQEVLRDDLRLIVMSATLDPAPLSRLLDQAPVLACDGRQHPVTVRYRAPGRLPLPDHLRQEILRVLREETGSVLVFLPGEGEIRRLADRLQDSLPPDTELCPLYGQLSGDAQDRAISAPAAGRRKLVLATAIAETSLTIEGVAIVIDAGQMRSPRFDPGSGMTRLVTQRVAQANAEQRRGRAGRLGPGLCVRLWSEEEQQRLRPFATPEILETDLADLVLALADWGRRDPAGMAWLDIPPAPAWAQARELLTSLGALTADGGISAHGQAMLRLGLPPRLAHLVLRGRAAGLGRLAADLAALLAERDLLGNAAGADIHNRLALLRGER
ncbi:MAG: ATP-dependent helicase HrpB, partial [Perlucidibaca sp.]